LHALVENYKTIRKSLEGYPLWKAKFEEEINRQLAYANIRLHNEEIFEVVDQQKAFK
jgi:hypothetical protein